MRTILVPFASLAFWIFVVLGIISGNNKKRASGGGKTVSSKKPVQRPAAQQEYKPGPAARKAAAYRKAHDLEADDFPASGGKTKASAKTPAQKAAMPARRLNEKDESYLAMRAVLSEDRKHDWMARQLAEEERALRRNFSDLGALHDASCAADDLKKSHRHDNTIDSAEVR